ncbi:BPTI/Kunitz domain-containing protein-like [Leguminivora glycinivorella]|uniref:BPTI/Kunitz domain-containing protein-like n=1 Tax=Leguminivora glycinivorella TaxID=1035111 RepID=UPI00200F0516|nr:BPTI/Kunitz domain-containing protein-like [Leguminivora glycinivorella]
MTYKCLLFTLLLTLSITNGKISYNTVRTKLLSRATVHIPKVINRVCLLMPDEGPCRAEIMMYYFSPESMNCTTFRWGGCQGNGNRFDTADECSKQCTTQPGQKAERPTYCKLSFDYGFCFGADTRWYYDNRWHVCRETIYSGCGGNKNNFYSLEGCESICRFNLGPPEYKDGLDGGRLKKVLVIDPVDSSTARGGKQKT